jgi:choline dehydrogenase-like flavoprotein
MSVRPTDSSGAGLTWRCDLELIFAPAPYFDEGIGDPTTGMPSSPHPLEAQESREHHVAFGRPHDKPVIDPSIRRPRGYRQGGVNGGLRITARIVQAPAMQSVLGAIARPSGATELTDDTLEAALKTLSHTLYHPWVPAGWAATGQRGGSAAESAVSTVYGWPTPR